MTDNEIPDFHKKHTIFGYVAEGLDILDKINQVYVDDKSKRPIQNIRILHTVIIDDGNLNKPVAI